MEENMKKIIFVIFFFLLLFILSCKKSTEPVEQPCSPFTLITETDPLANIIGNIDTEDWKSSGILTVSPAYPNPSIPVCTIEFILSEKAYLKITVNKSPNLIVRTLVSDTMNAGQHRRIWSGKNDSEEILPDCTYRVYFTVTKDGQTYKTYGDVKLKSSEE
jgi:hypothetical protein